MVLNFHGFLGSGSQQQLLSGMLEKSDAEGFIAVHPEGSGAAQSWNGGVCCGNATDQNIDDVGFVEVMLDALSADLCIDQSRIFATGMSNGGFLAHRLACELSDRIAAIAPVAGVIGVDDCNPSRSVPVMQFHGTADTLVPWNGSAVTNYPSVNDTVADWASRNGCSTTRSQTLATGDTTCETYDGCPVGGAVTLCTVDGGGHSWPGGTDIGLGKTTNAISATDMMWAFFAQM
jgi:polyhydroxybutyrate depolymerase